MSTKRYIYCLESLPPQIARFQNILKELHWEFRLFTPSSWEYKEQILKAHIHLQPSGMGLTGNVCLLNQTHASQIHLETPGRMSRLQPVGESSLFDQFSAEGDPIPRAIPMDDYFQLGIPYPPALYLGLKIISLSVDKKPEFILHFQYMEDDPDIRFNIEDLDTEYVIPSLSQMEYHEEELRNRICSPTSAAMCALSIIQEPLWPEIIHNSYHPPTDLFGLWPQTLYALQQQGIPCLLIQIRKPEDVEKIFSAGLGLIVSLAWEEGELPGCHIPKSRGHLMVWTGIFSNYVIVNDPAAPSKEKVRTYYPMRSFWKLFQRKGGIAYLVLHKFERV